MRVVVVNENYVAPTETFIRAHATRLPGCLGLVHDLPPRINDGEPYRPPLPIYMYRGLKRRAGLVSQSDHRTRYYIDVLRRLKADMVLAEYGPTAVMVRDACAALGISLAVHFHGYDAHRRSVLDKYRTEYKRVFAQAKVIIAVSRSMRDKLVEMGAPRDRVFINPCGVDTTSFRPGNPQKEGGIHFMSVGRFVEKKAPHLALLAFHRVHTAYPESRLTMIGDGKLLDACIDMAEALNMADAVHFAGLQPHEFIAEAMQNATVFIQHSVQAADGDSEGAPVAIMEAGASGLPVVSTRHAGIPDIVKHGTTGYLVEERDVESMGRYMCELASSPEQVTSMGSAARSRIEKYFGLHDSIDRLASCLAWSVGNRAEKPPLVPTWIE